MLVKDKRIRLALWIYTLLGFLAIGVCFIVDFATNKGISWSVYVLYAVPYLFLAVLPMCFNTKYNYLISCIVVSIITFPFLALLDSVTKQSNWFLPLGLPIAANAIIGLWVCGLIAHFVKARRIYLIAGLTAVYGVFLTLTAVYHVTSYVGHELSPMISIICIFSFVMVAAILATIGYFRLISRDKEKEFSETAMTKHRIS